MLFPAIMLTVMATAVAAALGILLRNQKRRRQMTEQLASELNMSHTVRDDMGLLGQLKHFDLFRREKSMFRNGKITNLMRRTVGDTEVFLFDYAYTVSTGKSSHTFRQTVFFANDKEWYLPDFKIQPETWWHKVQQYFGALKDINFNDNAEFSEKYLLTGQFETLIRQQFDQELQYFFLERPPVHIEGSNYYLIAYKPKKLMNADETRNFFEHCCQLVKSLKEKKLQPLLQLTELPEAQSLPPQPEKLPAAGQS